MCEIVLLTLLISQKQVAALSLRCHLLLDGVKRCLVQVIAEQGICVGHEVTHNRGKGLEYQWRREKPQPLCCIRWNRLRKFYSRGLADIWDTGLFLLKLRAFGSSSTSPFGSQSVFGQTNNANNNPFAPKPFGSTTPFGSQTGGSIFGGSSTGVFGATQSSSPLSSTTTFGASASPAFGSSLPAFGASSTPAFGESSVFGQKPVFGDFGSTAQTSPFGTLPQSQPTYGSNVFGSSTPFGVFSQPAFGTTTSPTFGSTSTPAFGSTSMPAFGAASMPAFGGTSTPAFGSPTTPLFGSTGTAFGASNAPAFGSGGAFGASSSLAFGSSSIPAFGASSTPAFGASSSSAFVASGSAFGTSSSPSFSFGSSAAFGQSTSAFGSSPFGTTSSPFGSQSSVFGTKPTISTFGATGFGQSAFGGQRGGSRVAAYIPTPETDATGSAQPGGKQESISAMPVYKDKSHEELRWEDYQLGDKGGPLPANQTTGGISFAASSTPSNPFASSSTFGQSPASLFSTSTSSGLFAPKAPAFSASGFGTSPALGSSPFGPPVTSNIFGSTASTSTSIFGTSASSAFGSSSPSIFGSSTSSAFGSSPSLFNSASSQGTTPSLFGNSQSSPLSQSNPPSFGLASSAFGQSSSTFGQGTAPSFGQSGIFNSPSTGFGNLFSSSLAFASTSIPMGFGQTTLQPSFSAPFQPFQPSQTAGAFSNFGQAQIAGTSGFGVASSTFGPSTLGPMSSAQSNAVSLSVPVTNPFGTLPAMPQMSIGHSGTAPSIQYGISSIPDMTKPASVKISSLLTSRHLFQRRTRLPARKYLPKNDNPKVLFFCDDEETPRKPKADALFIPRENPRALVIYPMEKWSLKANVEKTSPLKGRSTSVQEKENSDQSGFSKEPNHVFLNQKSNDAHSHSDHSNEKVDAYITLSGHRAGEAAIVYEHGADLEALMPKLNHSDYFTIPGIQELAATERAEPGFCRCVKDFVVGRHGYGSVRFFGETDVRRLDLESLIQFDNREVIVYMDDSKKPPIGQGLNKPAEITLLNIKCFDKKTGKQYTEGLRIDKYKEMLKKKAENQGAEFVSYDPIDGEWKFRVNHFSTYNFQDEEDGFVKDDCLMLTVEIGFNIRADEL
ncbi:Nuclear pore complex protein Nup98-Nup96-like, autopeptidase S59 domain [Dillenia turbinata]|uniref:Nucleoporin autopeptidase n=1 Tax=Dillenia turbinata TaxID=194707 RepID=A0AAN8UX62_9MAGN